MSFHRLVMSAALAVAVACAAPFAAAADAVRGAVAPVAIDGVDVEQVAVLGAGARLDFTVFGTTGATVTLRIDGGRRVLELIESEPGVYEGRYVVDDADAIRPESGATATLRKNGAVAYGVLDEPLLLAQGTVPWSVAGPAPAGAEPVPAAPPLHGTPVPQAGGATAMPIPNVILAQPQARPPVAVAAAPAESARCADCAFVESIRPIETTPPRSGAVGTISGAIVGALLGKEVAEAHNRRVATFLGAIGGALAGRQIERQATRTVQYDVDLRLADGTLLKRRYEQAPPFAAGATIRLGTPVH